ncbi:energy transducer TonB [Lysobacter cavernae]|uniref:Protein TonB n=1 Tax=Lysobacter cavernae TaxID=1685901 RepID=A0ABV7RUD6_9GAMM
MAWMPGRRSLLWVLLAFVGGLLLFALVLSRGRDAGPDRARGSLPTATGPDYAPLPAPLPAARDDNASSMGKAPSPTAGDGDDQPRLVETTPPPPPAAMKPVAPPAPVAVSRPEPIAGQTPAPRYPTQALRRGESGTVMVRAQIGADGTPTSVSVATGSGSRQLDRAAVDAVRRWRFRPALANGQPTTGTVMVPISFDARR